MKTCASWYFDTPEFKVVVALRQSTVNSVFSIIFLGHPCPIDTFVISLFRVFESQEKSS